MASVGREDPAKRMNPKAVPTTMAQVRNIKTLSDIMTCRNVDVCLLVPAPVPMSQIAVLAVVVSTICKITRNAYCFVSFICAFATHTMCLATTLHTNPFPIPLQRLGSSAAGWARALP